MAASPYKEQILQGEALFLQGDYHGARAVFETVLEADPGNVHALNDMGLTCAELGSVVEASHYFEHALTLKPGHEPAFFNLLDLLIGTDEFDLVLEAYVRYGSEIPEGPEKEKYRNLLEQASEQAGEVEAAAFAPGADEVGGRAPAVLSTGRPVARLRKHLILLGQPRSGTTIFWKILRQDRRFCAYDEPFAPHLRYHVEAGVDSHKQTMGEYLQRPALVRAHWSAIQPYEETYPHFVGHQVHYLRALLDTGAHVCIDTIRCLARVEHLRQVAPDALLVHLVRDPRAWVTSHLRPYGRWLPDLPEQFFTYEGWFDYWMRQTLAKHLGLEGWAHEKLLQLWQYFTERAERAQPDLTLSFEHFANNPEAVVQHVCEHLELDYEPLDYAAVHPPHAPHQADDARWSEAIQAHLSAPNRRFIYDGFTAAVSFPV